MVSFPKDLDLVEFKSALTEFSQCLKTGGCIYLMALYSAIVHVDLSMTRDNVMFERKPRTDEIHEATHRLGLHQATAFHRLGLHQATGTWQQALASCRRNHHLRKPDKEAPSGFVPLARDAQRLVGTCPSKTPKKLRRIDFPVQLRLIASTLTRRP